MIRSEYALKLIVLGQPAKNLDSLILVKSAYFGTATFKRKLMAELPEWRRYTGYTPKAGIEDQEDDRIKVWYRDGLLKHGAVIDVEALPLIPFVPFLDFGCVEDSAPGDYDTRLVFIEALYAKLEKEARRYGIDPSLWVQPEGYLIPLVKDHDVVQWLVNELNDDADQLYLEYLETGCIV